MQQLNLKSTIVLLVHCNALMGDIILIQLGSDDLNLILLLVDLDLHSCPHILQIWEVISMLHRKRIFGSATDHPKAMLNRRA
jgi:hypothetical protein